MLAKLAIQKEEKIEILRCNFDRFWHENSVFTNRKGIFFFPVKIQIGGF